MIAVLTVVLLAGAAVPQQAAKATPQTVRVETADRHGGTPTAMGLQGYSVVLVVGDMQGTPSGDTVPPAARKALTDLQAFLPYKRYQLLDAAWMVCCGAYRSPLVGRLRAADDREYSYYIETVSGENGKLTVRFWLREGDINNPQPAASAGGRGTSKPVIWDAARAEYARQYYEAQKERDEAEIQLRRAKQMHDVGTLPGSDLEAATRRAQLARSRAEELEQMLYPGRSGPASASPHGNLMDSTFSIAIGETVVIGTSRIKGDQALIALLTAAGKPSGAR